MPDAPSKHTIPHPDRPPFRPNPNHTAKPNVRPNPFLNHA